MLATVLAVWKRVEKGDVFAAPLLKGAKFLEYICSAVVRIMSQSAVVRVTLQVVCRIFMQVEPFSSRIFTHSPTDEKQNIFCLS